jgi:hypothetical protein
MRVLKIAGIVIVAAWMAYVYWRLEYVTQVSEAACALATVAQMNAPTRTYKIAAVCPAIMWAEYQDEVKPKP